MKERHEHYITDEVFVMMGNDFNYMDAHINYRNMDNLIESVNKYYGDKYEVVYSTPSEYVAAIAKYDVKWPTKYDDMMPIWDGSGYWTGFFSSRANSKSYIRRASHNFHASNQLYTLKALDQSASVEDVQKLVDVKNVMLDRIGILQHHDAVTGTGRQAVANDYNWKISTGMDINNEVFNHQVAERIQQLTGMNST
jgi:lysosomal alpha-mannosidase